MAVRYEWDAEEVDEHGDVQEHWFADTYAEALRWAQSLRADGKRADLVLVRDSDGDEGRSWAYLTPDGKLPERFEDAWQRPTRVAVPERFHAEVARASALVEMTP